MTLSVSVLPAVYRAAWQMFAVRPFRVSLASALTASHSLQLPRLSTGLPDGLPLISPPL